MVLRVLENFAGIGTQRMALENLGITHEVVGITEIDKFAIKSYEAIHGEVNNLGDISKVDVKDVPDHDLFTYSFPCQDISIAGKQSGFEKGGKTRSGLLWECEKVIRVKRPKYLLMENVKNLVSKKFKQGFEEWLRALEEMGYTNYWQVLNAKDYGVPQNRERVFCVSILGEHEPYEFPEKETLELRLKDILEDEVDEKFYLDDDKVSRLTLNWGKVLSNKDLQVVGNTTVQKDNYVVEPKDESLIIDDTMGFEKEVRVYTDYSPSLRASRSGLKTIEGSQLRIRKLTPKEYWRLMGISDDDFAKAQEVNSNTQLYKQAGNAIVVDVLEAIFTNMFK